MRFTSISFALLVLARSVTTGVYAAPAYADAQLYVADLPQRDLTGLLGTVVNLIDQILGAAPAPLPTDVIQQIIQKLGQVANAASALPIGVLPTGALPTGALPVRALPSSSSPASSKPSVPLPTVSSTTTTTTTGSHAAPVAAAQTGSSSVTHSSMRSASYMSSRHPSSTPRASSAPRMRRQSPPQSPSPTSILSTPLSVVKQGTPTPATPRSSSTTSSTQGSAGPTPSRV